MMRILTVGSVLSAALLLSVSYGFASDAKEFAEDLGVTAGGAPVTPAQPESDVELAAVGTQVQGQAASINSILPLELIHRVMMQLPAEDVRATRLTCRDWQHLSDVSMVDQVRGLTVNGKLTAEPSYDTSKLRPAFIQRVLSDMAARDGVLVLPTDSSLYKHVPQTLVQLTADDLAHHLPEAKRLYQAAFGQDFDAAVINEDQTIMQQSTSEALDDVAAVLALGGVYLDPANRNQAIEKFFDVYMDAVIEHLQAVSMDRPFCSFVGPYIDSRACKNALQRQPHTLVISDKMLQTFYGSTTLETTLSSTRKDHRVLLSVSNSSFVRNGDTLLLPYMDPGFGEWIPRYIKNLTVVNPSDTIEKIGDRALSTYPDIKSLDLTRLRKLSTIGADFSMLLGP